jgi:Tfp pilus assembly protein PilF
MRLADFIKEGSLKRQYLCGMLLLLLFGIASPGFSAERSDYHTRLSEGVTRLNENDLGGARQRFEQALAENPEGVEAHYYIGITDARAGRTTEAIQSFQKALAIDRTFVPAHFDLGVLYYQTGQDELALSAFETVEKIDPTRAKPFYYESIILQRQGKAKEAAAKMEKALALDPDLALEANFGTGVASYQAGDFVLARKAFQDVMALSPGSEAAQSAVEFLDKIDLQEQSKKRWDLTLSTGVQYDTNVILEPARGPSNGQSITDEKDIVGLVYLRGRYQWLSRPEWTGRTEYSFYQNFHRDDLLKDFNVQNHNFVFNGGRRIGRSELLLQYELQYATLGGDAFLFRQSFGPRFILPESKQNLTEFTYQFGAKRFDDIKGLFPNNSERDVRTDKAGFTHYSLLESKGNLHGGYFFEREIAGNLPNEDDWTFSGHKIAAGFVLPPWKTLTVAADAEYILRQFDHANQQPPGSKREDHEFLFIATLSKGFGRSLDLSVQYLYQKNDSNIPLFEYDRSIYGLIATVKF